MTQGGKADWLDRWAVLELLLCEDQTSIKVDMEIAFLLPSLVSNCLVDLELHRSVCVFQVEDTGNHHKGVKVERFSTDAMCGSENDVGPDDRAPAVVLLGFVVGVADGNDPGSIDIAAAGK